jgi:hypothetical protein
MQRNTMLANCFDPNITKALHKQNAGAQMQVTVKEWLDHMKAKYGKWGMQEIKDSKAQLDEPWDGNGEIDNVIDKFEEVEEVAKMAGAPIGKIEMITKLLDVIDPVTDFGPAVREITMKAIRNWTWEKIKEHLEKMRGSAQTQGNSKQRIPHSQRSKQGQCGKSSEKWRHEPNQERKKGRVNQ